MRNSILLTTIILFMGCQNQPAADKATSEPAHSATAEPLTNESVSDSVPEQPHVEPNNEQKCAPISCGAHQICVEGQCACGDVRMTPQDAATWECVDGMFRCYREEGCTKDGGTSKQGTLLGEPPTKDDENDAAKPIDITKLPPLEPNARYYENPPVKSLPYSNQYIEPIFDSSMDIKYHHDDVIRPKYCDGVVCDGICRNQICYEKPGADFKKERISSNNGNVTGDPKDDTWVCASIDGCKTKYGTWYTFGESFAPTGQASMTSKDDYVSKIVERFPQYKEELDKHFFIDFEDFKYLHFEIPNQYELDEYSNYICRLGQCCCGKGECTKDEICTDKGKCRILNADSPNEHEPRPAVCGVYAKQTPPKEDEYRPDYEKMCPKDDGCPCGDALCPKASECHDGTCTCAGVPSPGSEYECKQGKWKCTDPEKCSPDQLYQQAFCGEKAHIGNGYVCRMIVDPDVPRTKHHNPYVGDDDPHYDQYEWQCGLSGGCACGDTQCLKGESCIDGECYCGRKRALAAEGWRCENGRMICSQEDGCDCVGIPKTKGDSCYPYEGLFADEEEYEDAPHVCGDNHCPAATKCNKGQCLFYSTPQKISKPDEYISNWGFPQCNQSEGCSCGEKQCKQGEFCHQNTCLKTPTLLAFFDHTIEYVPVPIEQFNEVEHNLRNGDYAFVPNDSAWKFGYRDNKALPYQYYNPYDIGEESPVVNHSGVDFVRQYAFEKYYRTRRLNDSCRGVPYPKGSSGFACIVGIIKATDNYPDLEIIRYLPNEIGWICTENNGCTCGESSCSYQQSCIDQQCVDFTWIKNNIPYKTSMDYYSKEEQVYAKYYTICEQKEGCPCGKTQCYFDGFCMFNEYCHYSGPHNETMCPGIDTTINDNGTCSNGKYLYGPFLYQNTLEHGLMCLQDKCACGEVECAKGHYCVEPGRCI
ncbi:MAG: hypothetical protein J6A01_02340 [Proteobacteria bacterium]|nr:hypothetical protein [Pseudomonadota bacterium]